MEREKDSQKITQPRNQNLTPHLIPFLPPSIYYIPSFLTPSDCLNLLSSLPSNRWITLSHRRLQAHPSPLTPKTNTLLDSPLPPYLSDKILTRFETLGVFEGTTHGMPNHVLVNEYLPGQGILPHEDGGAYAGVVATVSLGACCVLDVYEKHDDYNSPDDDDRPTQQRKRPRWRILQEPGSLLVTTGEAYTDLLHGIAEVEVDEGIDEKGVVNWGLLGEDTKRAMLEAGGRNVRETRVSLTYRDVVRVSKVGSKIFGRRK